MSRMCDAQWWGQAIVFWANLQPPDCPLRNFSCRSALGHLPLLPVIACHQPSSAFYAVDDRAPFQGFWNEPWELNIEDKDTRHCTGLLQGVPCSNVRCHPWRNVHDILFWIVRRVREDTGVNTVSSPVATGYHNSMLAGFNKIVIKEDLELLM